ncbi:MAG: right-handed parallel beta-helix repeat-containing protein [Planctomycetes bacterium]|nr:right-handed parallel beta-helix repeat-containing protein [Planctomycetota bacterium]
MSRPITPIRLDLLAVILSVMGLAPPVAARTILYVDDDAPPGGNGLSWNTAYRFLQDALAHAAGSGGPVDEIRVGQGVYEADRDEANPAGTGDREASFRLVRRVALIGGFAGHGAPNPNERDVGLYETVLNGDLAGNDRPGFVNYGENSYHVVTAMDVSGPNSILDGVTITHGNANGEVCCYHRRGGGMTVVRSIMVIRNCTFTDNAAFGNPEGLGGGLFIITDSDITVSDCRFIRNTAQVAGGGVSIKYSNPTFIDCDFIDNWAAGGGGLRSVGSDFTLIGCRFVDNFGRTAGGGVNVVGGSPTLVDCIFYGNWSDQTGGGVQTYRATTRMSNCTFTRNRADWGAGIFYNGYPTLYNCIVWANTGGQLYGYVGSPTITYSDVQGGWPGEGNINADPFFIDPVTNDYHLSLGSPCIDTGDPAFSDPGETDADGLMRVWDGDGDDVRTVDMGPFEFGSHVYGDLNCDDAFNGADIDPFFLALGDPAAYAMAFPNCDALLADMNADGSVNGGDIDPFFQCLGGACP